MSGNQCDALLFSPQEVSICSCNPKIRVWVPGPGWQPESWASVAGAGGGGGYRASSCFPVLGLVLEEERQEGRRKVELGGLVGGGEEGRMQG